MYFFDDGRGGIIEYLFTVSRPGKYTSGFCALLPRKVLLGFGANGAEFPLRYFHVEYAEHVGVIQWHNFLDGGEVRNPSNEMQERYLRFER